MENASKALIMAGGVLIGVLILSLAVYLFADFGSTSAEVTKQNEQKQITEFNSKFTAYEGYKDKDGNWSITIYDIITLAGYAKENNEYYDGINNDEKISVEIDNGDILDKDSNYLINKYVDSNGNLTKFSCSSSSIEYNTRGKIRTIGFYKVH